MPYLPRRIPRTKVKDDKREKWLVGAKILAYLKYPIYSAAFKDPIEEPCRSIREEFYRGWRRTFRTSELGRSYQQKDEEAAGVLVCQASAEQQAFLTQGR